MNGVRFQRIQPSKNEFRFYVLLVAPTLWGTWALVRRWGRIGISHPCEIALEFTARADAEDALTAQAARRARRGYEELRYPKSAHVVPISRKAFLAALPPKDRSHIQVPRESHDQMLLWDYDQREY